MEIITGQQEVGEANPARSGSLPGTDLQGKGWEEKDIECGGQRCCKPNCNWPPFLGDTEMGTTLD